MSKRSKNTFPVTANNFIVCVSGDKTDGGISLGT